MLFSIAKTMQNWFLYSLFWKVNSITDVQLWDFIHVRFSLCRKMNSFILCVSVLGNVLYVGLSSFRVDHEPFKNCHDRTDIPHEGSDWADKLVCSSLCAAVPEFQFRDQFKEPRYWVTAHGVSSLQASTALLSGYVPWSCPSHKGQKFLPCASGSPILKGP